MVHRVQLLRSAGAAMRTQHHRRADQRAGLVNMHVLQLRQFELLAHRIQIDGLASGHATTATGMRQEAHHLDLLLGPIGQRHIRDQLKRQRLQAVPRQQCRGFSELHVHGRLSPPQHVVVHAGQVVMHQRIGVNAFHCAGHAFDTPGLGMHCLSRCKSQQRAHALATAQHRITHGLVK